MNIRNVVMSLALALGAAVVFAEPVSWRGGDGAWDDANWDPRAPQAGDDVLVESGTVTLSAQTPVLASLTVTADGVLSFDDGVFRAPADLVAELRADAVAVTGGGTITHAQNRMQVAEYMVAEPKEWKMNARVFITCGTLTVDADSAIDVAGKGYGELQEGSSATNYGGPGPGGCTNLASRVTSSGTPRGGGGHGGAGSWSLHKGAKTSWLSGLVYDSLTEPIWCGSGGDPGQRWNANFKQRGGFGGGAVRIVATGAVVIDGSVSANSLRAAPNDGGSGSGGSVWITCQTIAGAGLITTSSVREKSNDTYGGGGRISLVYDATAQDGIAAQSLKFDSDSGFEPGTIYFTDDRFLGSTFSAASTGVRNGRIFAGTWGRWQPMDVTVDDVWIGFEDSHISNFTIPGKLHIKGGSRGRVDFGGDVHHFWGGRENNTYRSSTCRPVVHLGALEVSGQNSCYIFAAATNGVDGATGAELIVDGQLRIDGAKDAWNWGWSSAVYPVCHPINGSVVRITAGSVSLNSAAGYGASINACDKGYGSFLEPGGVTWKAYGPGAPTNHITSANSVAVGMYSSHGGAGAVNNDCANGSIDYRYGSIEKPIEPGTADFEGNAGGGVVWVETTGTVAITNKMDTASGVGLHASAKLAKSNATGGSVYVKCRTLEGLQTFNNTTIAADSADSTMGAPGRVAIDYDRTAQTALASQPELAISAAPKRNVSTAYFRADLGTVWLPDDLLFRNGFHYRGVTCGEVHFATYADWNPGTLVVDNSRIRLPVRMGGLVINGDLIVTNQGGIAFGGGAYCTSNIVRRVPLTIGEGPVVTVKGDLLMEGVVGKFPRTEIEIFAGTSCGDGGEPRLGGLLDVKGNMTLKDDSWILPTSNPFTGESVRLAAKSVSIDATSGVDATGRGYAGCAGAGSCASGPGGARGTGATVKKDNGSGSGGFGGHGGAYGGENEWGLAYGQKRFCDLTPGSGGCGGYTVQGDWDGGYDYRRFGGAGGGAISLVVARELNLAGSLLAVGEQPTQSNVGAPGSGGSISVRCGTWNPSDTAVVCADGGAFTGKAKAIGGGGGRVVIRRTHDNDPTPVAERLYVTAACGASGSSIPAASLPEDGTVWWGWNRGMTVIVR